MSARPVSMVDKVNLQLTIVRSPSLSATAKLVGVRLVIFFNLKTGQCNPSAPTLAKECVISRTSVFDSLKALVAEGFFSRGAFDPKTSTYNYIPNWGCLGVDETSPDSEPRPDSEPVQIPDCTRPDSELPPSKLRTTPVQNLDPNIEENIEGNTGRRAHHRQPDSDLFEDKNEQQKPNKVQGQKRTKRKTKALSTPIPPNWQLPDDGWSFAASRGFTGDRIETEIEKFRAYYEGTGKSKANWEATWRSWILNDQRSLTSGRGPPPQSGSMADGIDQMNRAMKAKQDEQQQRTRALSEF